MKDYTIKLSTLKPKRLLIEFKCKKKNAYKIPINKK